MIAKLDFYEERYDAALLDGSGPEYPLHPDRFFQALVDGAARNGFPSEQEAALRWLENEDPPSIDMPSDKIFVERATYVPIASDRKHPDVRKKRERRFASVNIYEPIHFIWRNDPPEDIRKTIETMLNGISYIGRSTSFVHVTLVDKAPEPNYVPSTDDHDKNCVSLRVPHKGELEELKRAVAESTPDGKRRAPPVQRRYVPVKHVEQVFQSKFDGNLIPLALEDGSDGFDLRDTLPITDMLHRVASREAIRLNSPARELISGHTIDGQDARRMHIALVPLANVGNSHADGHIMGVGLLLPRDIEPGMVAWCLGVFAEAMRKDPQTGSMALRLDVLDGHLGLVQPDPAYKPQAFARSTLCGPARTWATVTPVVLDRAQSSRCDPELGAQLQRAIACKNIGLPQPTDIEVMSDPFLQGSYPCREFPPLVRKNGCKGNRRHVHAVVTFSSEVEGPVVCGAGRYLGYGVFRPVAEEA